MKFFLHSFDWHGASFGVSVLVGNFHFVLKLCGCWEWSNGMVKKWIFVSYFTEITFSLNWYKCEKNSWIPLTFLTHLSINLKLNRLKTDQTIEFDSNEVPHIGLLNRLHWTEKNERSTSKNYSLWEKADVYLLEWPGKSFNDDDFSSDVLVLSVHRKV